MKIVLLGSGNVASHLGPALKARGNEILQVWSRNAAHAAELAGKLDAAFTNTTEDILPSAELYIISVSDDAIAGLAEKIPVKDKIVVHTSGTRGIEVLSIIFPKAGVFYPLQTFSKQKPVDFSAIPVFVEGSSPEVTLTLYHLADQISKSVQELNSEGRLALHVAAVFACNFTNHFYTIAKHILLKKGLDFALLRPLIAETAAKVQQFDPEKVQTGPAVRRDEQTMQKHFEFLADEPKLRELYAKLSESIKGNGEK